MGCDCSQSSANDAKLVPDERKWANFLGFINPWRWFGSDKFNVDQASKWFMLAGSEQAGGGGAIGASVFGGVDQLRAKHRKAQEL
ncbi:hypothetical protein PG984_000663 [Apiospora sp. TS-2023a]